MGKRKKKSKLQKAYAKSETYYKRIKKVYCPALKANVYFTLWGWNHITKKDKFRTGPEMQRRWSYLPLSKKFVKKTTTIQHKNWDPKDRHWRYRITALVDLEGTKKINIILTKHGKKYFFFSNYVS